MVTRHAGIKLLVVWKRRSEEERVRADLESRGPWLLAEDFQLDFSSYSWVFARYAFTCDAMATYRSKMCVKYFSVGYEFEAAGTDFFAQRLDPLEFYWVRKIILF